MIGIKKEKCFSGNVYIIRTLSVHHFKGKLFRIFMALAHLNRFQCGGTPDGTKNIHDIRVLYTCLKFVMGYLSHSVRYAGFPLLKVIFLDVVD
jgi:hypothetical protein